MFTQLLKYVLRSTDYVFTKFIKIVLLDLRYNLLNITIFNAKNVF